MLKFIARKKSPLEIKIIDAASQEKKLVERIIGFTEYDWHYSLAEYTGTCSQPVEFSLSDEVICDLLLDGPLRVSSIGEILGLDPLRDPAERYLLDIAIGDLVQSKMLEHDSGIASLTDIGVEYAKKGVKYSTFTRKFSLYTDINGLPPEKAKAILSRLKSERFPGMPDTAFSQDIETVKLLAEAQAPEIHYPEKNFLLQSCQLERIEGFVAKVWVVLLEDFRDNALRAIVYDQKQDIIIDALSDALDRQEYLKAGLLDKLIAYDEDIEFTSQEKHTEQLEAEQLLIYKQAQIEAAADISDTETVLQIRQEIEMGKRHFNSLEFEVELKKLFDDTSDTIIIQSPWVRDYAFRNRVPFIKSYLKKGGRVYIAYSENESFGGEQMVQDQSRKIIDELDKNLNFYHCELPAFHYKNVWLVKENGSNSYYSGSYNILSFFVSKDKKNVRQEKMTKMRWDDELVVQFNDVFKAFGLKYINKAVDDFNAVCQNPPTVIDRSYLQKLRTINTKKLRPFHNIGIQEFDDKLEMLENTKKINEQYYSEQFFLPYLNDYMQEVRKLLQNRPMPDRKSKMVKKVTALQQEFKLESELYKDEIDKLFTLIAQVPINSKK
ncbi:hypothetical protein LRS05_09275 [Flavobacterium sp. J372]|uniref:hypothetical protein n=1 Tax=Flavobacterium sp. J372 TaxID=2898436 RepID=UPI002151DEC5|nr:hypothetical protein [Flavobacterium sp. J372]MCR5862323.1 hypothetical protein [Flavobacterium sp. J372]